jgi:hypothetical protein
MGDLERSGMAAPKTGQGWWIITAAFCAHLSERSQTGSDNQCSAAEEIAPVDRIGHFFLSLAQRHPTISVPTDRIFVDSMTLAAS